MDKNIPIEKQFKYLRSKFSFQAVRTAKFFRKKFGDDAERMYEELDMYMKDTLNDYNIDPRGIPFEVVAAMASNDEDKSHGFMPEVIHKTDSKVHSQLIACPYNEAAKTLGFNESVCKFVRELNAKYMTENTSYKMELAAKIAEGNEYCVMQIFERK